MGVLGFVAVASGTTVVARAVAVRRSLPDIQDSERHDASAVRAAYCAVHGDSAVARCRRAHDASVTLRRARAVERAEHVFVHQAGGVKSQREGGEQQNWKPKWMRPRHRGGGLKVAATDRFRNLDHFSSSNSSPPPTKCHHAVCRMHELAHELFVVLFFDF